MLSAGKVSTTIVVLSLAAACTSYAQKQPTASSAPPKVPAAVSAPKVGQAPPTAPALSEIVELKRQNAVMRANLLQARVAALQAEISREQAEIKRIVDGVKASVEKEHPGWTLSDVMSVVKKE